MNDKNFLKENLEDLFHQIEKIKDLFIQTIWDKPVGLLLNNPSAVFTDEWKQLAEVHWEKITYIRNELLAKKTPNKYKEGHAYLIQSLDYLHQAKDYAAMSYRNNNVEQMINIDLNTCGMVADLVNQAVGLLNKAIPIVIDEETT